MTQIFAKIDEMWQSVMGPDGLVGQSLISMKAQFESSIPILLEPIFGGIDDIMSGAVDLSCEFGNKMLTTMTDVIQKNSIFLPGYCWAKEQVQNMLDNPVMAMGILFNAVCARNPSTAKSAARARPELQVAQAVTLKHPPCASPSQIMTPLVEKFLAWADGAVLKPLATSLNTAGLTSTNAFFA